MSLATELIEGAPGSISEYAGIALPAGFLWANGQNVSRSTYPRLFAALTVAVTGTTTSGSATVTAISTDLTQLPVSVVGMPVSGSGIPAGTTILSATSTSITLSNNATASASGVAITIAPYGVGDGSTTFGLPDRRGRGGVGHDLMGTTAAGRLTTAGGGVNGALLGHAAGTETYTLTAAQLPAHSHGLPMGGAASGAGAGANIFQGPGPASGTSTLNNTGGGSPHPIVQPSIVMNYIIKT